MADTNQLLLAIADLREEARRAWLLALVSGLLSLVLGSGFVWKVFLDRSVYMQSSGGPGLVKPGVLDDGTAADYAERWLESRWTFQPETFKEMREEIMAFTHPTYRVDLKAELDTDARLVQQFDISSQLHVLTAQVLDRKGKSVLLAVHARRTLTYGKEQQDPEYVDVKLVVTLLGKKGVRRLDVVTAQSHGMPAFGIASKRTR